MKSVWWIKRKGISWKQSQSNEYITVSGLNIKNAGHVDELSKNISNDFSKVVIESLLKRFCLEKIHYIMSKKHNCAKVAT